MKNNMVKAIDAICEEMPEIFQRVNVKSIAMFERQLWSYSLNHFRGKGDFISDFAEAIDKQLTRAWNEGAREVEVEPEGFTAEDVQKLHEIISNEYNFILGLAGAIDEARITGMDEKDFRTKFMPRILLWVNRYKETVNAAKIWFGGKVKLEWVLGQTEQSCDDCMKLSGTVAFASEWLESGIQPQKPPNEMIGCGGWRCDCKLVPTNKRRTYGARNFLFDFATSRHV